LIILLKNLL